LTATTLVGLSERALAGAEAITPIVIVIASGVRPGGRPRPRGRRRPGAAGLRCQSARPALRAGWDDMLLACRLSASPSRIDW
jgi:hypothetical protein